MSMFFKKNLYFCGILAEKVRTRKKRLDGRFFLIPAPTQHYLLMPVISDIATNLCDKIARGPLPP